MSIDERLPWFHCNPSKWLGAIAGMGADEGYVYSVVLLRVYEVRGPIDDDAECLARRTGLSAKRVAAAMARLFERGKLVHAEGGRYTNPVAQHEIEAAKSAVETTSAMRREAAKRRWAKRKQHQQIDDASALLMYGTSTASGMQTDADKDIDSDSDTDSPSLRSGESGATRTDPPAQALSKSKTRRATRLPADWMPSEADYAAAEAEGFTRSQADRIANKFRDYWLARSGAGAAKLDWPATWRNWVRREAERQPPYRVPYHDGPRPQRRSALEGADALRDAIDRGFDLPPRPI